MTAEAGPSRSFRPGGADRNPEARIWSNSAPGLPGQARGPNVRSGASDLWEVMTPPASGHNKDPALQPSSCTPHVNEPRHSAGAAGRRLVGARLEIVARFSCRSGHGGRHRRTRLRKNWVWCGVGRAPLMRGHDPAEQPHHQTPPRRCGDAGKEKRRIGKERRDHREAGRRPGRAPTWQAQGARVVGHMRRKQPSRAGYFGKKAFFDKARQNQPHVCDVLHWRWRQTPYTKQRAGDGSGRRSEGRGRRRSGGICCAARRPGKKVFLLPERAEVCWFPGLNLDTTK